MLLGGYVHCLFVSSLETHHSFAHMLCTLKIHIYMNNMIQNPTNFSAFALLFPSSQVTDLSSVFTETIFFFLSARFFPLLLLLFLSVLLQKLLRKGAFLLSFLFTTPSNCPVDLLSLSVCAFLSQCIKLDWIRGS